MVVAVVVVDVVVGIVVVVVVALGVVVVVVGGIGVVLGVIATALDVATALPFLFVAVTVTRTVNLASPAVRTCVEVVSPVITAQAAPVVSQRDHWNAKVGVGPDQSPVVLERV